MTSNTSFVDSLPSPQNIMDLFAGEWSSMMPEESALQVQPGHAALFSDARITWATEVLGPFDGLDILELGPLEGAHSTMLERAGARSVTAVEANKRAFLKCLCVKEVFGLGRVQFKLGSFLPYLEACPRYDVIVASGVLYHMTEPLRLLELSLERTDKVYLWSHYYDAEMVDLREDRNLFAPLEPVNRSPYWGVKKLYPERALSWQGFSGGSESYAVWLDRPSLLRFFADRGFAVTVNFDHPSHPNGPALALCARR